MPHAAKAPPREGRLALAEVLDWLVEDRMVAAEEAERLKKERRYYRGANHPLAVVADQQWKSALPPYKSLALEPLTSRIRRRAVPVSISTLSARRSFTNCR